MNHQQLRQIMPMSGTRADAYLAPLNETMRRFEIDNGLRIAGFLACIAAISSQLHYTVHGTGKVYDGRRDLGNTRPDALEIAADAGVSAGEAFKPRGLLPLIGYDQYAAASKGVYDDERYLAAPDLLEEPQDAAMSAGWYWMKHGCNDLADEGDISRLYAHIRGECGSRGEVECLRIYANALEILS